MQTCVAPARAGACVVLTVFVCSFRDNAGVSFRPQQRADGAILIHHFSTSELKLFRKCVIQSRGWLHVETSFSRRSRVAFSTTTAFPVIIGGKTRKSKSFANCLDPSEDTITR